MEEKVQELYEKTTSDTSYIKDLEERLRYAQHDKEYHENLANAYRSEMMAYKTENEMLKHQSH